MKITDAEGASGEARTSTTGRRKRRTQEERSASTRRSLIDAAVECLNDLGYLEATVEVVATRAGVSRGAVQHHFGSRNDLLVAVVDDFGEALSRADLVNSGSKPAQRVSTAIDATWQLVRSRHFLAVLHIWIATSKVPEVANSTTKAIALMERRLDRQWQNHFSELRVSEDRIAVVRHVVLATLRGLALRNFYRKDRVSVDKEIAALKQMVTAIFS